MGSRFLGRMGPKSLPTVSRMNEWSGTQVEEVSVVWDIFTYGKPHNVQYWLQKFDLLILYLVLSVYLNTAMQERVGAPGGDAANAHGKPAH